MNPRRLAVALLLLSFTAGCGLMAERREHHEADVVGKRLVAAGFRAVPADTPAKQAHLASMPKLLFSSITKHGQRRYVLADPDRCRCLYVGDEAAYQRYTNLELQSEERTTARAIERADRNAGAGDSGPESIGPFQGDVGPGD
jgi:hypothetical protein